MMSSNNNDQTFDEVKPVQGEIRSPKGLSRLPLYDARSASRQQVDWQLISLRMLAFFSGAALGITLLAVTLTSVYTGAEGISHPMLIGSAALFLLLALAGAHKCGGREELTNSGLFATSGIFAGYASLLGAASMIVSSIVTTLATVLCAKLGQSTERSVLHGGHNKIRSLLARTAVTSKKDLYRDKTVALINLLPLSELNYHNKHQMTLLEDAILRGNKAAVIALINRGVDTESAFTTQGRMPSQMLGAFLATKNVDAEIVDHIRQNSK